MTTGRKSYSVTAIIIGRGVIFLIILEIIIVVFEKLIIFVPVTIKTDEPNGV